MVSAWLFGQALSSGQRLSDVRIDEVSDDELAMYFNQARASGLSPDQVTDLLRARGLPDAELMKLQQRVSKLGQNSTAPKPSGTPNTAAPRSLQDSTTRRQPESVFQRDTTVFGAELYTNTRMDFAPNLRIATPANYVLGPGDELLVDVYGYSEKAYKLTINPEGTVYIPNMGPVSVAGLSVDAAATRIRNQMGNTIYKAVKSGQTRVSVSLGNIRSIQVTIIGQAMQPGTYTVPSLATVFNALYQCGGPNNYGSYRNIELLRNGNVVARIDLYDFLHKGSSTSNVLLRDQDVIRIPYAEQRVQVSGSLRRKGKFELKEGERLQQLIGYAGGFSDSAYRNSLTVERITDSGQIVLDVLADNYSSFIPAAGDRIVAGFANSRYLNRVVLLGAVLRPGNYQLTDGLTLKALLEKAGGLQPEAFKQRGSILRKKPDLSLTTVSFSPEEVLTGSESIVLQKDDEVRILSKFELRDQQFVVIEGEVRKPGRYQYSEEMTAKDLVLMAGGFTSIADSSLVEVSRRMRNQQVDSRDYQQTETFELNLTGGLQGAGNSISLKPFDLMLVRPLGNFEAQRSVYVDGMVQNPGRYVLQYSTERISQVLRRTGGFRGGADSAVVNIKRLVRKDLSEEARRRLLEKVLRTNTDSLMNNPDLRNSYLNDFQLLTVNLDQVRKNPGSSEDLIVEDGDLISIPRASTLVKISGEVYNPTALPFQPGKTSAKHYVQKSGGFTTDARKGRLFVLYPDGRTGTVGKFLFFKNYPNVTPRSEVFIPSKNLEKKKGLSTGEWVAISSILATLTTLIVALAQ